jgi:hypothetical protein
MWAKGKQVTYVGKYSHQEFQTPFNNLKKWTSGDFAGNRRKNCSHGCIKEGRKHKLHEL